jgi:hypothetical protein
MCVHAILSDILKQAFRQWVHILLRAKVDLPQQVSIKLTAPGQGAK